MRQEKSVRSNKAGREDEETDRRSPEDQTQAQRRRNRQLQQQGQQNAEMNAEAQRQPEGQPLRAEEQQELQNLESDAEVARMPRQQGERSSSSTRRSRKRRSSSNSHGRNHHSSSQPSEFSFGARRRRNEAGAGNQEDNLVEQYRAILDGDNGDAEERNKAQNVFVAAAGNLQMAAQLYWDDYFATQAATAANPQPLPPMQNNDMDQDSSSSDEEDDFSRDGSGRRLPHRKIRRSLDGAFRNANNGSSNNNDSDPGEGVARLAARDAEDDNDDAEGIQENNAENNNENAAESVSVSDDEAGGARGVWRSRLDPSRRRRGTRDMERRIREAANAVVRDMEKRIREASPPQRRGKLKNASSDEPQFLIPDNDWLQDHEQDGAVVSDPLTVLWGNGSPPSKRNDDTEEDEGGQRHQGDEIVQPAQDDENGNAAAAPPGEGNLVADEEIDDEQQEQRRRVSEANGQSGFKNAQSGIPYTWLNASFSLSDCGMGIALKPPKPEDIDGFAWREQQNQERRQGGVLPPPYHCKSITAVFSVVQAMLLTGVSIQGDEVNCTKAQTPWGELNKAQREIEFDSRLKDILAALIFIAAEASQRRKKQAVSKAEEQSRDREQGESGEGVNEAEKLHTKKRIQYMKRRLRLIATCSWEDDPAAGMPQAPGGPSHRNIQVATSLTNIQDISLYVSSNLRDFKAPGGVALFMETIARIHGGGVLEHMMKVSISDGTLEGIHTTPSLIACTCQQRQKHMHKYNSSTNVSRIDPAKLVDTTPPGHECTSHQLISLLLTGRIESSWNGWSNSRLGFGMLAFKNGQMGLELTRPEQPVWMLQGKTGYTVLYLAGCKGADPRTVSKLDTAGAVLEFNHWNSWYGQRRLSGLKLITAGGKCDPPIKRTRKQDDLDPDEVLGPERTLRLLREQREFEYRTSSKARQQESCIVANEAETNVKPEEVKAAKVHPDDERHYPGNYRMWRFDMGEIEKENSPNDEDRKLPGNNWIPYYRLTARQKHIADLKLGPKIREILWTRWPNAIINDFTPINGEPPVV